jgi:hypothetical protein
MKPQVRRTGLWRGWLGRWTQTDVRRMQEEERALRRQMEAAKREMEAAEAYFQNVTDPELVDHAIYTMEAAKRKYLYLYRQLRLSKGGTVMRQEGSQWI